MIMHRKRRGVGNKASTGSTPPALESPLEFGTLQVLLVYHDIFFISKDEELANYTDLES